MAAITDIQQICYNAVSCTKCPFWRRHTTGEQDPYWDCYFNDKVPGEWDDDKIEEMISGERS